MLGKILDPPTIRLLTSISTIINSAYLSIYSGYTREPSEYNHDLPAESMMVSIILLHILHRRKKNESYVVQSLKGAEQLNEFKLMNQMWGHYLLHVRQGLSCYTRPKAWS